MVGVKGFEPFEPHLLVILEGAKATEGPYKV